MIWDALLALLDETICAIKTYIHEKHPWRTVTFSKVAGFRVLQVTFLHGCFSHFLNCTHGTNMCKASHIASHHLKKVVQHILGCWGDRECFRLAYQDSRSMTHANFSVTPFYYLVSKSQEQKDSSCITWPYLLLKYVLIFYSFINIFKSLYLWL